MVDLTDLYPQSLLWLGHRQAELNADRLKPSFRTDIDLRDFRILFVSLTELSFHLWYALLILNGCGWTFIVSVSLYSRTVKAGGEKWTQPSSRQDFCLFLIVPSLTLSCLENPELHFRIMCKNNNKLIYLASDIFPFFFLWTNFWTCYSDILIC